MRRGTWGSGNALVLCDCAQCVIEEARDPVTHKTLKGKYFGRNEFYEHRRVQWQGETDARSSVSLDDNVDSNSGAKPQDGVSTNAKRTPSPDPKNDEEKSILTHIQSLNDALDRRASQLKTEHETLVFCQPPHALSHPIQTLLTTEKESSELNTGILALVRDNTRNTPLLEYEQWLAETFIKLEPLVHSHYPMPAFRATLLQHDLAVAVTEVEQWKQVEWDRQRVVALEDLRRPTYDQPGDRSKVNTEPYMKPAIHRFQPVLLLCYLLVAVVHLLCGVSLSRCGWLLEALRELLSMSCELLSPPGSTPDLNFERIISAIPADARTIVSDLSISPTTKPFVCCPSCFACYSFGEDNQYPDRCTAQLSADDLCGAELRKTRTMNGRLRSFPARQYIYHDFKDWFARLMCRPGMEESMDRTLVEALEIDDASTIGDFYDTDTLRNLQGPDKKPFVTRETSEGRYVFSICMDGFMPTGKGGSASVSVGAIYLACMNLPASIRYREENLYLCAIIPGPKHPSQEMINPLLAPIVDDFLELWYHGARFSQTPCCPKGKVVRCVIGPLVSDMLAARQMAGFSSHSSDLFCSFCLLSREHIDNLDWWAWPLRSWEEQRAAAERWRATSDPEERARIMREEGIRWSELFRLPYWDPLVFTAIDPMHALFLGLLHRHCEKVWGMSSLHKDGLDGRASDPAKNKPAEYEMQEAFVTLKTGSDTELEGLPKEVLRSLCKELKLRFAGRKGKLCSRLREYKRTQGFSPASSRKPARHSHTSDLLSRETSASSWNSLQDFRFAAALNALDSCDRISLKKFSRPILQKVCQERLRESAVSWDSLTHSELLIKLSDYITSSQAPSAGQSVQKIDRGMKWNVKFALATIEYGTKTDLKTFRPEVLVEVCALKCGGDATSFETRTKAQLLEELYRYRPDDSKVKQGKAAVPGGSNGDVLTDADLIRAEDIFEHGSRTALRKLPQPLIAALCISRLSYSKEDAKGVFKKSALIELEELVRQSELICERPR
ncbi:hypothetical protein EVJ58_g6565 [Rhodofomes roseus]|uniref:SAP domain-containing protein n=1 Tax=Rhodofomes roseus TaxID=34475 RepID=A0A4Y9Y6P3_9APHY|nr:hypothetical protein EVJ58_g6565 [Rhodofomes roseus]